MITDLKSFLERSNAHPFLFLGSGFSRRYLGSDDWKALISHFAKIAKPESDFAFEWYQNESRILGIPAQDELPAISTLVEKDYNSRFLTDDDFAVHRQTHSTLISQGVSPFKIGVAQFFLSTESSFGSPNHQEELSALGHARSNVAGVITTNFDRFLEKLFPDHVPYIGQEHLLFSASFGVGELYKIHGCVSDPGSLILTKGDYDQYRLRNAYLSAKLLTIFLEHPIIFLGYSLTDANIRMIFQDIANCLSEAHLSTLSQRLFFIERVKAGRPAGLSVVRETFGGKAIEFQRIVLDDYSDVFKAIAAMRSSYPPKILRQLKKDIYELILSASPKERIRVVDIDSATDMDSVEYVMGVGVSQQLSGKGYGGLDVADLIADLLVSDRGFDPASMAAIVLPKLGKQFSNNLPMFKYLAPLTESALNPEIAAYVEAVSREGIRHWIPKTMGRLHLGKPMPTGLKEVKNRHDLSTRKGTALALEDLAFVPEEQIDLEELRDWLVDVWTTFDPLVNKSVPFLSTNFRRAAKIYDWLRFGRKKTPAAPKERETL